MLHLLLILGARSQIANIATVAAQPMAEACAPFSMRLLSSRSILVATRNALRGSIPYQDKVINELPPRSMVREISSTPKTVEIWQNTDDVQSLNARPCQP
jgi:hypothetical protein